MRTNNRRNQEERRNQTRRKETRRENNRGIVDRRGAMDRRSQNRRMEDKEEKIKEDLERIFDDQIEGRNAVLELLESDKDINKIYITKGELKGSINKIIAIANEKKVIIVQKDKKQMDMMAQSENYQGVIAVVPPYEYVEVEDILEVAKERNEDPAARENRDVPCGSGAPWASRSLLSGTDHRPAPGRAHGAAVG